MSRIAWMSVLVVLSVVLVAPVAAAQTAPSLFLSGGAFASVERDSHLESAYESLPSMEGTVPGGSVAIGAFLTPRVSVRAEFTFRGEIEDTISRSTIISGQTAYTEERTSTDRVNTGSVLLAYHARAGKRVRVEYLGGIAFVYQRRTSAAEITITGPFPIVPPPLQELSTVTYGTVAIVGLDVPVRLTTRIDLVPQLRAQSTGGLTLRPGVSVRVSF